jgi:hypothetical protein
MDLPLLRLHRDINYVGVFLTFGCNLACSYCINDPDQIGAREQMAHGEMSPDQWIAALSRLQMPADLPFTFQGGEPTLYHRGRGVGMILAGVDAHFDLLTNLALPPERMKICLNGQTARLRRPSPYPSIRVSYHPGEMKRAWSGRGIETLVERCEAMRDLGFTVAPDKRNSDVGIYLVSHPNNVDAIAEAKRHTAGRVAFEPKEFLGLHEGKLYGTYRYPFSTNLVAGQHWPTGLSCECRTTELLIDPLGFVWPCHHHLYETWMRAAPQAAFDLLATRKFQGFSAACQSLPFTPLGHILDPEFDTAVLRQWHGCSHYGSCIGCDTKVKNDRFQSLEDANQAHTSVEIRGIDFPEELIADLPEWQRTLMASTDSIKTTSKTKTS